MSRVGFCIHGVPYRDQRDYFPFHFVDIVPEEEVYYSAALGFDTGFEYICRAKEFTCTMDLTVEDDLVGGDPVQVNFTYSQRVNRIYKGDERFIQESFRHNYQWPDWEYEDADFDPFIGNAFTILSTPTQVPMIYRGPDAFAAYIDFGASIDGGDPGDRSLLVQLSTRPGESFVQSSVIGTFMEKPFLVYESGTKPDGSQRYVTGAMKVEATAYWSYGGIWNQTTGAQEIVPVPGGY